MIMCLRDCVERASATPWRSNPTIRVGRHINTHTHTHTHTHHGMCDTSNASRVCDGFARQCLQLLSVNDWLNTIAKFARRIGRAAGHTSTPRKAHKESIQQLMRNMYLKHFTHILQKTPYGLWACMIFGEHQYNNASRNCVTCPA